MDRKRTVVAASGISVVLVAGSSAFAFANGIFVAHPVDRAGSFQALQARLIPETAPRPPAAATGAAPPGRSALPSIIAPTARPAVAAPIAATFEPTSAPRVAPAATPAIAHSGASTVPGHHSEDDHEAHEDDRSDD